MKKSILSLSLAFVLVLSIVSAFTTPAQAAAEIPSGGLVIFNKDSIVITATKINRDKEGYVTDIDFTIANNSAEEISIMTVPNVWSVVKINNFTFKEYLSSTVAAGKTAREKLRLDSDDVKLFGLKDVFDITMQFQTYVSKDFSMTNIVKYEPSTVIIQNKSHSDFTNGNLVFTNKDADIYSCGFLSGWSSNSAVFVVKNKTNADIQFSFGNLSVNSIMSSGSDESESLYKNTYRAFRVPLDEDFTKDNVSDIEFTLRSGEFLEFISAKKDEIGLVIINYQNGSAIAIEKPSSWAEAGVNAAIEKGFIPADLQSKYTSVITRAEFCRMAVKWLEYSLGKNIDAILADSGASRRQDAFSDTSDPAVLAAYALGITGGTVAPTDTSSGQFTPNGQFSREQAATMIRNTCRAAGMDIGNVTSAGFEDIGSASAWAVDSINYVHNAGVMSGTSTTPLLFGPKTTYTREQSILTFNNIK